MGHPMGIELTHAGLLGYLANHYTTRGAHMLASGDLLSWISIEINMIWEPLIKKNFMKNTEGTKVKYLT